MLYIDPVVFDLAHFYAQKHGVNVATILGIAIQESGLNPFAIGDAGRSFGLMQLNLDGAGAGAEDHQLLELAFNFDQGCAYYSRCVDAFGNREDAVSAYNQGIQGVRDNGRALNAGYWQNVCAITARIESEGVLKMSRSPYFTWS